MPTIRQAVKRSALIALVTLIAFGALVPLARAQTNNVVITLGVPTFTRDAISDKVLAAFTAANPGVTVQVVIQDTNGAPSPANDVGSHLDAVQKFTSAADVVLFTGSGLVTPEASRAGYYLNLQPLMDSDSQLNSADFVPQLLHAYQWDQGTWALPLSADATVLTYDPAAFDKAKLAYPTEKWTIDDLINAVKALNVTDSNGKITTPAIELYQGNNDIPLYMSLVGKALVDPNAIPNPPQLDQPEVRALFDRLKDLQSLLPASIADFGTAPIRIESVLNLAFNLGNNATPRKGVLLPGGHAYLDVSGAAVSAATQHPDQAYALARFMTTRPEINRFSAVPARVSVVGQTDTGSSNNFNIRLTPELKQLVDQAVTNGLTPADRRFYDFLSTSAGKMVTQNLDGSGAIADAQGNALKAQQTALDRKNDAAKVAVVGTPVPTADANKGITLKFGVTVFATSLPKKAEIQALADRFAKNTPGVAKVDIQNGFDSIDAAVNKYDCFYLPYSAVPSASLSTILNLDPYLNADKSYNAADYVGGAITQVQRDNKVWALPMGLAPTVMWYDPLSYANAGATKPAFGWGVDSFKDSLIALKPVVKDGQPPFYMSGPGGEGVSLLMLIASYGGLPIDWSTTPPTVAFTDPTNAAAMRQVLDLAKAKLIDYKQLGSNFGISLSAGSQNNPLYSEQLNGLSFGRLNLFGGGNAQADQTKFEAVTFPKGTKYQALSYSSGTLYISAKAQNPDICYKWISTFGQHPELLSLMPASRAQLADTSLEINSGKALAAVYRDVAKVLDDPNTLKVPSLFDGGSNISGFVVQYWLFQAWDDYVLNNKDLDTSLTDAQTFASAYVQCAASVPPYDPAQQKYNDYIRGFTDCAVKADPRLKALLGNVGRGGN